MNYGTYIDFTASEYGYELSDLIQYTLENYLCHGLAPGGFTTAVLASDLMMAAQRADHWNTTRLTSIARWVEQNAPADSWGSYEKVDAWIRNDGNKRGEWFDPIEKQYMWDKLKETA